MAGVVSGYFPVDNGVRQGGVLSPVLFCVYIDNVLCILSRSGVGCFLGVNYVGAMRHLHMQMTSYCCAQHRQLCANYCQSVTLSLMNMTSNSMHRNPSCWWSHRVADIDRQLVKPLTVHFSLVEHVESFLHLGHIITPNLSDKEDIHYRRNFSLVKLIICYAFFQ